MLCDKIVVHASVSRKRRVKKHVWRRRGVVTLRYQPRPRVNEKNRIGGGGGGARRGRPKCRVIYVTRGTHAVIKNRFDYCNIGRAFIIYAIAAQVRPARYLARGSVTMFPYAIRTLSCRRGCRAGRRQCAWITSVEYNRRQRGTR